MDSVNLKVSVIIALYNYEKYIRKAVESVKNQTYDNWEIIIIDDCSTDGSYSNALELKEEIGDRLKLIRNSNNRGVSYTRNIGLQKARGEYIAFLDADDYWHPDKLKKQLEVFNQLGDDVDIVHTGAEVFSDLGTVKGLRDQNKPIDDLSHWDWSFNRYFLDILKKSEGKYYKMFGINNPTLFSSYMIRKRCLSVVDGFDEGLLYQTEDWLFMFKCSLVFKFYFIPEKLTYYRIHLGSYTNRVFNSNNFLSGLARDQVKDRCWEFAKENKLKLEIDDFYCKKIGLKQIKNVFTGVTKKILYDKRVKRASEVIENKNNLKQLVLFVTNACNLSCQGCFYADQLNTGGDLSFKEIEKILELSGGLESVLLTGGEPFLRSDIADIIKLFIAECGVNIVTSGSLPKRVLNVIEDIISSDLKHPFHVAVSLDGFLEKHNKRRGREYSYFRAIDTLRILCNLKDKYGGLTISVNTVISPDNMEEITKLGQELGARFNLNYHNFEIERSNSVSTKYFIEESDKLLRVYNELLDIISKYYPASYESSRARFAIQYDNIINNKGWCFPCRAGKEIMVIYPNGQLAACEMRSKIIDLANFDYNLDAAVRSDKMKNEIEKIKKDKCFCTHGCWLLVSMIESFLGKNRRKSYNKVTPLNVFKKNSLISKINLFRRRLMVWFISVCHKYN